MDKPVLAAEKVLGMFVSFMQYACSIESITQDVSLTEDFDTAETLEKANQKLKNLRSHLKESRIKLEAYIEAQKIYKEIMGFKSDVTLYQTGILELIPHMDHKIVQYFQNQLD